MLDHLDDPQGFTPRPGFREEVKQRGRRIRGRRRLTAMIATAVVSASALTAVLAFAYDPGADEDTIVITPTPTTWLTTPPPLVLTTDYVPADPDILVTETVGGLTVTPATRLSDGDALTLRLDPPSEGDLHIDICAAEASQHPNPDPAGKNRWCGPLTTLPEGADASIDATRIVPTPDGLVDCAEAPGRCAVAVTVGSKADTRFAPLIFEKPETAEVQRIEVSGLRDTLAEGDELRLVGTGFGPDEQIEVLQCRADATFEVCGGLGRGERSAVDWTGRFEMTFTVFHEIGNWPAVRVARTPEWEPVQWTPCDPCVLRVRTGPHRLSAPITLADTPSARPRLTVATEGPLAPGAHVRLEGEGFQPGIGSNFQVGWCPAGGAEDLPPDTPYGGCIPKRDTAITVDDDGRFVIEGFPLPAADTTIAGRTCAAEPGACTIAIVPVALLSRPWNEGSAPLDLSG